MSRAENFDEQPAARWRQHQASLTLVGLIVGVLTGLAVGEYAAPLRYIGDAFVNLLQMTVLPYVIVALLANFGRLTAVESRRLVWVGGCVLLLLWGIGLYTVFFMPHAFPVWKSGSFFSSALTEPSPTIDLVSQFLPANFFTALSNNTVPAIVFFCIAVGLALAGIEGKQSLIDHLDVLARAFIRVANVISAWSPLGVFAIAASTLGTISWAELGRLQAYMIVYTASVLFLMVVVLPLLVSTCTPFSYRDVWRLSRNAVITAFATGKLLVVLPMLIAETERLFREKHATLPSDTRVSRMTDPHASLAIDVLFPLAYPLPHLGRLMGLLFIPFAAWFIGDVMTHAEYPSFLMAGLFSYFGGPMLATPFLLDQLHLPHDMLELFILSSVYCGRLGDALGVLHLVTFALLTTSHLTGTLRLPTARVLRYLLLTTLLGVTLTLGLRVGLTRSLELVENKEEIIAHMQLLSEPVQSILLTSQHPNPEPLRPKETVLQRIRRRGVIRVGFNEDNLPFAYFNIRGRLVGFDINMAHVLARDLGVSIEFVRYHLSTLNEQLEADHFDVVMSGLAGTLERAEAMQHSPPYMDVHLALVVPDYRSREFGSIEAIRKLGRLRVGFVDLSQGFVARLKSQLPEVQFMQLTSNSDYFNNDNHELDGLLISAESGSAYTLLHPHFEVVIPDGTSISMPLFYAIGDHDIDFREFFEHWLELRRKDGTIAENYEHWILGKTAQKPAPRTSWIRKWGWVD